ncbi:unnamed protein product [Acanthoscelides obtectus]|uniref:Major facilitator superfamily (MFS) profile domain-containing protein n=1 Tax=Acanthoscelides obtectus TaxID=200917 RepID=A0A9P0P8K1_ACAOB|nr:unnamed protein product [Acanthoscelides obtectus]CAK1633540.1 Major facilitator superfamily domain-containing protein 8 [Acanthoscelides obtectus]
MRVSKMTDHLKAVFQSNAKFTLNDDLETPQQYRERWRSIYIIYFTMFLISLGFSIIVTGVWPYLDKLDPTAGKEFMGLIVAANPFAQMVFSPIVGWWSNRLGSIRIPLIMSLVVFALASSTYSSLEVFPSYRKYWMLASRFLVGVSSANIAACRSYLSAATRYSERTKAVSMISLAQVLGFVIGPAVQAAVVPLGSEGYPLLMELRFSMYTASGWINVLLSLLNIYFFFPSMFKEHKIAAKEAMLRMGKDNVKDTWKEEKINYLAAWTLIVSFFIYVFNFMLLETLATPLTMDQFAWTKSESLWYMGLLMSVGAVIAISTFASIAPLSRIVSEVKIMIYGGFLIMVIGCACYIPMGSDPPQMYDAEFKLNLTHYCDRFFKNKTTNVDLSNLNTTLWKYGRWLDPSETNMAAVKYMTLNCGEDLLGCPSSQEWCAYIPRMLLAQFIFAYLFITFGYPVGVTIIQTLFSKVLGSKPQGVWMGLITGSGCLSRVMGPIFVTYIYEEYGTYWTFGATTSIMSLCTIWLLVFQKTLQPAQIRAANEEDKELKDVKHFVSVITGEKEKSAGEQHDSSSNGIAQNTCDKT